jgi:ribose-phosphate pyrophosphokinase
MKPFSLDKADTDHFPDGQKITRIDQETLDSEHVLIKYRWDWNTYQCLVGVVRTLQNNGCKVSLYIPYMFGSRSDRRFGDRECNYFRDVVAPAINTLGFEHVYTIDPHSDAVENCIPNVIKGDNEFLVKKVVKDIRASTGKKLCLVIPDEGAGKRVRNILPLFDETIQFYKKRDSRGDVYKVESPGLHETYVAKESDNYYFVVVDDICDGGATFTRLQTELKGNVLKGASSVLVVTHGIFSRGVDLLLNYYDRIYTTNSIATFSNLNVIVEDVWNLHDYGKQIFKK